MPIAVHQWRRLERILDGALNLEPAVRGAFLDRSCQGDTVLRAEVDALLRSGAEPGGFLDRPAQCFAAPLLDACSPLRRVPS